MRCAVVSFLVFASAVFGLATEPDYPGYEIPRGDVIREVAPEYPLEARRKGETGSGILMLHVDSSTGKVTSVTVYKSTGHKMLDDAGVRAFS
jgi:outer membrane biosynthesis protein TonB